MSCLPTFYCLHTATFPHTHYHSLSLLLSFSLPLNLTPTLTLTHHLYAGSIAKGEHAFDLNDGASQITGHIANDNAFAPDDGADAATGMLRPKQSTKERLLSSEEQFFDVLRMRSIEVDSAFQRSEVRR